MGEDMIPIMIKAAKESKGETRDLVLENVLPGITEEMFEWWHKHMRETRLYKMWHPDHISFEVEETGDPEAPFIAHPTEMIGKYGPSTMAHKGEPKRKFTLTPRYKNYSVGSHTQGGELLSMTYSEYEDGPNGLKTRAVHRLPAKLPQDLFDALYQHMMEEAQSLPKFLPELYAKEGKK